MTARSSAPNPSEVAARLTEAQRRMLRAASSKRFKSAATILRHAKLGAWPRGLTRYGLFEADCTRGWTTLYRLSAKGLAVRSILEKGDVS